MIATPAQLSPAHYVPRPAQGPYERLVRAGYLAQRRRENALFRRWMVRFLEGADDRELERIRAKERGAREARQTFSRELDRIWSGEVSP